MSSSGTARARALVAVAVSLGVLSAHACALGEETFSGSDGAQVPERRDGPAWIIDSFLSRPHLKGVELSVLVESVETGEVLFEREADRPMIPASNMKVVTGAAALELLGPDYRYSTGIFTDSDGVAREVDGNLYVKGSGDPSLVMEEVWKIGEELRLLGIERVSGDIVLDDTAFDTLSVTSDADGGDRAYHARTSALSANFNAVLVTVLPGASPGDPARVLLSPDSGHVSLRNEATTCSRMRRATIETRRRTENGENVVVVTGRIPVGSEPVRAYRNVERPTEYFGAQLLRALERAGVAVEGRALRGPVPGGATLVLEHRSKPLSLIVRDLNKYSNNFVAEQLTKTISLELDGAPGTTRGGTALLLGFLGSMGADTTGVRIADGSGFSRSNRLTCRAIAAVMRRALSGFETSYEFGASLSVSGTDGTLEDRMGYAGLEKSVRAKTGLLDGVTAISGVMSTARGERVLFSIIVNGFDCEAWKVHDLEHAILGAIYGA